MSKRKKEQLSANELLEIFNHQWATTSDIMKIGSVGYNRASAIRKQIESNFQNKKNNLPQYLVPMEYVIDYFKININYLKKVAQKGTSFETKINLEASKEE